MFDGEFASLEAMHSTNTIHVPKPIMVIFKPNFFFYTSKMLALYIIRFSFTLDVFRVSLKVVNHV